MGRAATFSGPRVFLSPAFPAWTPWFKGISRIHPRDPHGHSVLRGLLDLDPGRELQIKHSGGPKGLLFHHLMLILRARPLFHLSQPAPDGLSDGYSDSNAGSSVPSSWRLPGTTTTLNGHWSLGRPPPRAEAGHPRCLQRALASKASPGKPFSIRSI